MTFYRTDDKTRGTAAYQFAEALSTLIFHASSRWTPKDERPVEDFAKATERLVAELQGAPEVLKQIQALVCPDPHPDRA